MVYFLSHILHLLLDDLKDRRGYSHLKEEDLDRTMWWHRFGGGIGPVVKQNTEWMNFTLDCRIQRYCGLYWNYYYYYYY